MSLKKERVVFGQPSGAAAELVSLRGLAEDDPTSHLFKLPAGTSLRSIYNYFLAEQQRQYGTTLLTKQTVYTKPILQRHLKLLLKDYDIDLVKRAIKLCSLRCKYPFSVRMVRYYLNKKELWENIK